MPAFWSDFLKFRPMKHFVRIPTAGLLLACGAMAAAPTAQAQQLIGLTDENVVLTKGARKRQQNLQQSNLGAAPGAGENPFDYQPGGRGMGIAQGANPARPQVQYRGAGGSILSSISSPGPQIVRSAAPLGTGRPQIRADELPPGDVEGPPDGLTLEQAIDRLMRYNPDLRAK